MPAQRFTNTVPASRWLTGRQSPHPGGQRPDGTPRVAPGVYLLTRDASPQFGEPITVRVIRELTERQTYHGWAWIDCYVRHEALFDRVEVKDLHRCSVVVGHRS